MAAKFKGRTKRSDSWGDQLSNEMEGLVRKYPSEFYALFNLAITAKLGNESKTNFHED